MLFTRVDIRRSRRSASDASALIADYLAFDRQRAERRQYSKAFGGIAIIVLLGAAFGRVSAGEAWVVAGILLLPPLVLGLLEAVRWHRLVRRLNRLRQDVQDERKL